MDSFERELDRIKTTCPQGMWEEVVISHWKFEINSLRNENDRLRAVVKDLSEENQRLQERSLPQRKLLDTCNNCGEFFKKNWEYDPNLCSPCGNIFCDSRK